MPLQAWSRKPVTLNVQGAPTRTRASVSALAVLAGVVGATLVADPDVPEDVPPTATAERLTLELPSSYRWHISSLEAEATIGKLDLSDGEGSRLEASSAASSNAVDDESK